MGDGDARWLDTSPDCNVNNLGFWHWSDRATWIFHAVEGQEMKHFHIENRFKKDNGCPKSILSNAGCDGADKVDLWDFTGQEFRVHWVGSQTFVF